jgi:pimeloyl-ACP methyl ester carboxylesterase
MPIEREPEGKYINANGLKLHYHEFGSGFPLICIHGAGPGASGWSNFKGNVDAFAKKYRTILFDMPQFGKSDKPVIKDQRLAFLGDALDAFMAIPWAARRRSSSPSIIRRESTSWSSSAAA